MTAFTVFSGPPRYDVFTLTATENDMHALTKLQVAAQLRKMGDASMIVARAADDLSNHATASEWYGRAVEQYRGALQVSLSQAARDYLIDEIDRAAMLQERALHRVRSRGL